MHLQATELSNQSAGCATEQVKQPSITFIMHIDHLQLEMWHAAKLAQLTGFSSFCCVSEGKNIRRSMVEVIITKKSLQDTSMLCTFP